MMHSLQLQLLGWQLFAPAGESDSDSDYGYDLTASDEELLVAIVDRLSSVSPQSRPGPATAAPHSDAAAAISIPAYDGAASRFSASAPSNSPAREAHTSHAVQDAIAALAEHDLDFDSSELEDNAAPSDRQPAAHGPGIARGSAAAQPHKLTPAVPRRDGGLSSFVSKTRPRHVPTLLPDPDVSYPDLSRALSEIQQTPDASAQAEQAGESSDQDTRSPLLRFRTFPMKPFSVTDLTAGSWCELQYYYTLTKLPGGKRTRTAAMKRGSKVHEKLEREVYTPVQIDVTKKEDTFGLKVWNIIQGLRVLREQGLTRELEVWGMVDGNVVNGVIDGLSYENPDPELEEDVLSSRGGSQAVTGSQATSSEGGFEIFITDVKTRTTATPPPQSQVRVAIIQLFLYHRFLSDMASGKLDYIRVFERYGLNPDETFSDSFMAQIGALHSEVFGDAADPPSPANPAMEPASDAEEDSNSFVSAVSSPSRPSSSTATATGFTTHGNNDDNDGGGEDGNPGANPNLRYRTLRALLPLLESEIRQTFPHGANDLGKIVAVEYRYRGKSSDGSDGDTDATKTEGEADSDEQSKKKTKTERKRKSKGTEIKAESSEGEVEGEGEQKGEGAVICVNTFFVEPETLDLYLDETMRWWRGERPPRGVAVEETYKCRSCEFAGECAWRLAMEGEVLRRARLKRLKW